MALRARSNEQKEKRRSNGRLRGVTSKKCSNNTRVIKIVSLQKNEKKNVMKKESNEKRRKRETL